MYKFLLILFFIGLKAFSLQESDVNVNLRKIEGNSVTFEITMPDGWKMAKPPEINRSSGDIQSAEDYKNYDNSRYEVTYKIDTNQEEILKFSIFACKDICTIINKDFHFQPKNSNGEFLQLALMIIFGFIGGMLLNVMPCVFPVILLKLRQLRSKSAIFSSILGNYLSFLILASILIVLKLLGKTVSWGMHFQNLYFLQFSVIFFFLLMLNAFNKLKFNLSMNLDFMGKQIMFKDVISSMITTFIAIPCTAPLLGVAAAFAIQESITEMMLIFSAIATGFCIPYFLAIFIKIPAQNWLQSSIWSKVIGAGVSLVFVWTFWLLCNHITWHEILAIAVILGISFVCFLKDKKIFGAMALALIFAFGTADYDSVDTYKQIETAQQMAENDSVVILNITADWCLSCKYNHLKFESDDVKQKIQESGAKLIEIDITKQNDRVMGFVREHGRAGIPFTIIYGPKNKQGVVLGELPSVDEIIHTLDLVK